MKKVSFLIVISFFFTLNTTAQEKLKGNKNVITQHRDVTEFNSISIQNNLKVFVSESLTSKVSVETDENLQDAIVTRVSDGILEVYISQPIKRKKKLAIYIGIAAPLKSIEVKDNASIIGESEIQTDDLELFAKDNGSIKMKFRSTNLTVTAKDRSDLDISISTKGVINVNSKQTASIRMQGTCSKMNATLEGTSLIKPTGNCEEVIVLANDSGNFKGKDLLADYATVEAKDKSDVYVNVSKELIINIENTAKLYIYADPTMTIEKFADKSTLFKK